METASREDLSFPNKKELTVGDVMAMLKTGGKPYKGLRAQSYLFYNGKIYQFVLTSSDNQDVLFDQILSTFRFLQ